MFAEVVLVEVRLKLVRRQYHDHVRPLRGIGWCHDGKAGALSLRRAGGASTQSDVDFRDTAVAQVHRMGVALAAVADDRNLFSLDEVNVGVPVVVNAHLLVPFIETILRTRQRR